MDVAIIGAGITGLTLAYELEIKLPDESKIFLLEKDDKIGGKIQSIHKQDYLIEEGPDGFVKNKTAEALYNCLISAHKEKNDQKNSTFPRNL